MTTPLHALSIAGDPQLPALILLHGRGSDERDLLPVGRLLHPSMPVLSVRAPFEAAPWGYGPGYAWYRFLGDTTPEAVSFVAGQLELEKFVSSLAERFGVTNGFVLGGFSQGGTTALAYQLRHPGSARGIMVFSGFLADHPSVAARPETVLKSPIFWGHGTADSAITFDKGEAGWQQLEKAGAQLSKYRYEHLGHSISSEEIGDAKRWISSVVDSRIGEVGRATGQI